MSISGAGSVQFEFQTSLEVRSVSSQKDELVDEDMGDSESERELGEWLISSKRVNEPSGMAEQGVFRLDVEDGVGV